MNDAEWTDSTRRGYTMGMALAVPHFTIEDLQDFPDDGNRYELLDGVLLVTPLPELGHELVGNRLRRILSDAVEPAGIAHVFGPGAVIRPPNTQLQPDMLVVPGPVGTKSTWKDLREHWLAVEIISPSSRVYDRKFKRDAYHALGVREVWIVDPDAHVIEVSHFPRAFKAHSTAFAWTVPETGQLIWIEPETVFADL